LKIAFEKIAVDADESAFAVPHAVAIVAFVGCTVVPDLLAAGGRVVVGGNSPEDTVVHFFGQFPGWLKARGILLVAVVESVLVAVFEIEFFEPGRDLLHAGVFIVRELVSRRLPVLVIAGIAQRLWLCMMADGFVVFSVGVSESTPQLPVVVVQISEVALRHCVLIFFIAAHIVTHFAKRMTVW
jgi:hypothetical protein